MGQCYDSNDFTLYIENWIKSSKSFRKALMDILNASSFTEYESFERL